MAALAHLNTMFTICAERAACSTQNPQFMREKYSLPIYSLYTKLMALKNAKLSPKWVTPTMNYRDSKNWTHLRVPVHIQWRFFHFFSSFYYSLSLFGANFEYITSWTWLRRTLISNYRWIFFKNEKKIKFLAKSVVQLIRKREMKKIFRNELSSWLHME